VQKSLAQSAKQLIEAKLQSYGLGEADGVKVFKSEIQTPGDGLIIFQGMQDHTAESAKSLEGFHRAWGEEAQTLSDFSINLLRPTIRWEDKTRGLASELWFGWNPRRPTDAVDKLLRSDVTPTGSRVVKANWNSNPWFPSVLEQERQDCIAQTPDQYGHIWEGEYATVLTGAYFARHLTEAEQQGRIGFFGRDTLQKIYAFWDIGSSSSKADSTAIWICQFVGEEIRVLDYYEAVGQPFDTHINWLRSHGYADAVCVLPHDGVKHDTVYKVTPNGALQEAGFNTEMVGNQGKGAAMQRVEAVRRVFNSIRFNREPTQPGRDALGFYHEKQDEHRNIGLGPEHDWSSHGSDAFGLMAVWRLANPGSSTWGKPIRRNLQGIA
jgi:phage terminase large subunit